MKMVAAASLALACALTAGAWSASAQAQTLDAAQARAIVAPFYDALNAAPGKDAMALVLQATAPTWVSCGDNDDCKPRDKVAPAVAGFGKAIPNLKWDIREVLVAGDRIIVRSEATDAPAGDFMGVKHAGRSFKMMTIDIHTVANGKIVRSYHVEDWMSAVRQLAGK